MKSVTKIKTEILRLKTQLARTELKKLEGEISMESASSLSDLKKKYISRTAHFGFAGGNKPLDTSEVVDVLLLKNHSGQEQIVFVLENDGQIDSERCYFESATA